MFISLPVNNVLFPSTVSTGIAAIETGEQLRDDLGVVSTGFAFNLGREAGELSARFSALGTGLKITLYAALILGGVVIARKITD